jgi:hypothetical protein
MLVQEALLVSRVVIAILTNLVEGLLMDTLNMIVHRAGLVPGDTEATLIAANFLVIVAVVHLSWALSAGISGSIFCGLANCG